VITVKVAVLLRVDDEEPHEIGSVLLTGPEQITSATVELLRTVADEVEGQP
jgi:hypothetical protein